MKHKCSIHFYPSAFWAEGVLLSPASVRLSVRQSWGQIQRICVFDIKYKYKYVFVFVFDKIDTDVFVFVFVFDSRIWCI